MADFGVYTTDTLVAQFFNQSQADINTAFPDLEERITRVEDFMDQKIGFSWKTATSRETLLTPRPTGDYDRFKVMLPHRKITDPLTTFSVWNGSEWENYLTGRTEGRANDYWLDYEQGVLYVRTLPFSYGYTKKTVKVAYTYGVGETHASRGDVPGDIEMAATMLVAKDMVLTEEWTPTLPAGENTQVNFRDKADIWEKKAMEIIHGRQEFRIVD